MVIEQVTHCAGLRQGLQHEGLAACEMRITRSAKSRALGLVLGLIFALAGLGFAGATRVEAHAGHQHAGSRGEKAAVPQPSNTKTQNPGTAQDQSPTAESMTGDIGAAFEPGVAPLAAIAEPDIEAASGGVRASPTSALIRTVAAAKPSTDSLAALPADQAAPSVEPRFTTADIPVEVAETIDQRAIGFVAALLLDAPAANTLLSVGARSGSQGQSPANCPCGSSCGVCVSCTSSSCCLGLLTPVAGPVVSPAGARAISLTHVDTVHDGIVDPNPRPPNSASLI